MIGQVVGTYKIVSELGEGGVGTVYKGVDTMLDREVAIKVLRPELVSQNSIVERFRSEAITLAKLNHPNIATLFSLFRQGDELFMILEFVQGETVEDILQNRGIIPPEEALPFFCQALSGLNYAHQLNIIHRDIKPSNMILTKDNQLKILDFGIARLLGTSRMTKVGNIIGTLEYMSPEQIRGEETDARSDIYGLGIMLYEILTGRLPFESDNEFVLMKAHTEETPPLPTSLNPDISPEIESVIIKAIAKNPDERFQSANEFLQNLLELGFSSGENPALGFESIYQAKTSASHKQLKENKYNSKDFPKDVTAEKETSTEKPTEIDTLEIEQLQNSARTEVSADESNQTEEYDKETLGETAEFVPSNQEATNNSTELNDTAEFTPSSTDEKASVETPIAPKVKETVVAPPMVDKSKDSKNKEIIGTRLGNAESASTPNQETKATRLGAVGTPIRKDRNSAIQTNQNKQEESFFGKLNWIHYSAVAVGLFLFLSILGIAAATPFLLSSGKETPPIVNDKTSTIEVESGVPKGDDSELVSEPSVQPNSLDESLSDEPIDTNQPTPVEVVEDKKLTKKNDTGGKKNSGRKSTKKEKPSKNSKKSTKGGKKRTKGGKKKTRGRKNIVRDLTRSKPKRSSTPSMTDN